MRDRDMRGRERECERVRDEILRVRERPRDREREDPVDP
jgi:hypothetical protein